MDTFILFYRIHRGYVEPIDYINWALRMLENDCSSFSLNILSSLRNPLNIFEVEDYFRRASSELNLQEPSYEKCAGYYIQHLSRKILEDESNAIDTAYEIYEVLRDLEEAKDLEVWYNISEMIDDFRYGDNPSKLSKVALIITIVKEAKNQLKRKIK